MCIVIIYFLVCDVINFELALAFLPIHYTTWPKNSEQKINLLYNEKSFLGEIFSMFHNF